jgi:hypothetical protein
LSVLLGKGRFSGETLSRWRITWDGKCDRKLAT